MLLLAGAKRKVAAGIGSGSMKADSRRADFCTYLSASLWVALLLNALLRSWWADPMAGLVMVPIIGMAWTESSARRVATTAGATELPPASLPSRIYP
jgi:divalent metal cation (Fe/Co/Zn/Cd) transporter